MQGKLLRVPILEGSDKLTMTLILHNHGPLFEVNRLRCHEFDLKFHDLQRLQTEHGLNLLLDYLGLGALRRKWVLGPSVRLRFDNLECTANSEVESHISLRVIGERQLLNDARCIIINNRPLLHVDMLSTVHLD